MLQMRFWNQRELGSNRDRAVSGLFKPQNLGVVMCTNEISRRVHEKIKDDMA